MITYTNYFLPCSWFFHDVTAAILVPILRESKCLKKMAIDRLFESEELFAFTHIGFGRRVRTSHLFFLAPTLFHVSSVKEIKVFLTFTRCKFVLFSPSVNFPFLGSKISH